MAPKLGGLPEELVTQTIDLPSGPLRLLQPEESAELPDDGDVEWAPVVPYWSVLWRSGVALAEEVDGADLGGRKVVELGCGLGAPSLAAARAGATVLATDDSDEALALVERSAEAQRRGPRDRGHRLDAARRPRREGRRSTSCWRSDLLYERANVGPLLALLPRLAPEVWLADPGRTAAGAFLDQAQSRWSIETTERGVVRIHRLRIRPMLP